MIIKRRNFIQITTLSLATAMTGFTPSPFSKKAVDTINTKALTINMPADDGNYVFLVDGQKQIIRIANHTGSMNVPEHACILEYTAADGKNKISVYIDQGTSQSFLLPGMPTDETEVVWNTVLLGNPVRGGKILATITGPNNTHPVVEITDVQGRTLIKERLTKTKTVEEFEFDVQRYAKGILLMKISYENFSQTLKVVHGN
jgi:RNase P/RNase MRP subunit p29